MAKKTTKEIGDAGEKIAREYLLSQGYGILTSNYRYSRAEIDIIASEEDVLIFLEVKTRSYTAYGQPEESVSQYKEQLIFDAANAYMEETQYEGEIRFDIISVIYSLDGKHTINHYKDAFFYGV